MTYEIYEEFMPDLIKKAKTIQKKCQKYGCDFKFEIVEEKMKEIDGFFVPVTVVDVQGKAQINDWVFVATIEHMGKENLIKKALTDIEIPAKYWTANPVCEHCHTVRKRKDTYLVYNTMTKEFKQVGKSCLKDFTNGMDIELVANLLTFKQIFEDAEDELKNNYSKMNFEHYFDTLEVLSYAWQIISHFGYQKTRYADGFYNQNSSKQKTIDFLNYTHDNRMSNEDRKAVRTEMKDIQFKVDSEESKNKVKEILSYIEDQEETNDFMHNLKVLAKKECISEKNIGILISMIPCYLRTKEKQGILKKSDFVGQLKDRVTVDVESITLLTAWESLYGQTFVYKFVDKDFNIFTWKTTKQLDNTIKQLIGTVKAHNEYKGTKQTELTRCRIK